MAKVLPVPDSKAFVNSLEQSTLLSPEALAKAREAAEGQGDAKAIARELLKAGSLTKWQAGQLLHGYTALVVGKYALLDQLGSGEMGRVYLAEHISMNRRVALKVLSRRHTQQPAVLKRFLADAERVAGLDHRNLIHIYDVNQDGDRYFLVMEYVEGQDLQTLVEKSGKLPAAKALEYIRQVAEGLKHAHEQQLFHGDLKPSNVLVDTQGAIKVLDIGLGKLTETTHEVTGDESVEMSSLASRIFHAPEQHSKGSVDHRADIYSLGSTLFFLLTGKLPSGSVINVADVERLAPDSPAALAALCHKLTAKDPAERPQTMDEALALIDAVSQPQAAPAKAKPESSAGKPKPAAVDKAAPPPPKAKKPPTAKSLDDSSTSGEFVAPMTEVPTTATEVSGFGNFSVKKPSRKPTAPAKKAAATKAAATEAEEEADAADDDSSEKPVKAKRKKKAANSRLPLILAASIGGGVLLLAGIVGLVIFLFSGGDDETQIAKADATPAAKTPATSEEANPEANPETNPAEETNPAVDAPAEPAPAITPTSVASAAKPVETAEAKSTPATAAKSVPADAPPEGEVKSPAPMPPPETEDKAKAKADEKAKADAKAADMPKADAKKPEAAKPAAAKPAPPKAPAKVNPLAGFATTFTLPKLPPAMETPGPETFTPVSLGPCKVSPELIVAVYLKGGETAVKGGKQKFSLMAADGGTALQDWEISFGNADSSVVVAKLGIKDQQFMFNWTPEAANDPLTSSLMNCALDIGAGDGHVVQALREPITADPLTIEYEKPTTPLKWVIDHMPDPDKIFVEVTKVTGLAKKKLDPETGTMDRKVNEAIIWTGPGDEVMVLGLKLTSTFGAKNISVAAVPQYKLQGMVKPAIYVKKPFQLEAQRIEQAMVRLNNQIAVIQADKKLKEAKKQEAARAFVEQQVGFSLDSISKAKAQSDQLKELAAAASGNAQVHFRVYYLADEEKVVLLTAGAPADDEKDAAGAKDEKAKGAKGAKPAKAKDAK